MYVVACVTFPGDDAEYEVGADVDYEPSGPFRGFMVGEPDISAPDVALKWSRLVDTGTLPEGWSAIVEEALIAQHEGTIGDMLDSAADYRYDAMREEEGY